MNSSKQLIKAVFSFSLLALVLFSGLMAEAREVLATSNPVMLSATKDSNTQITLTFDQNVQTNETNPGDFIVTDAAGRTYEVTAQADGTPGDTDIVLTVSDLSKIVGKLIVTYNNAHNEISDAATGLGFTATDATGVVIERPFVIVMEGSGIALPVATGTYHYTVDWGDGQVDTGITGVANHNYNTTGSHTISISGNYPRVIMADLQGRNVKSLEQWGSIVWESMEGAFEISDIEYNATDAPDLSQVTSMARMFEDNRDFEADINHWDVSNVQDMSEMFAYSSYNQPLSGWDVGNVTNMHRMFYQANQFNQSLSDWNVSDVTDMSEMFYEAFDFNQPLNSWNVGSVVNMSRMFFSALKFNQPLSDWDVSKVTDMSGMFEEANRFDQPIGDWDVSQVTDMSNMFEDCFRFNQSLSDWDVRKVTDMSDMFYSTGAFNGAIGDWDVSAVTDMSRMFDNANAFIRSLANWDIRSLKVATDMLDFSRMSPGIIDETFMAWNALAVKETGVDFGSADFRYCEADAAIQDLINNNGWVFGSSLDQNCEVYVNGVTVVNGTYGIGDNLDIIVTMSLPVAVDGGSLAIPLTIGSNQVDAELFGTVNNTQTMTFRYLVKEGDLDEDGIVLGDFISFLNGASILYKGAEDDFSGRLYYKPLTTGVLVDAIKPLSGMISSVQQDSGVDDEDGITNDNTLIFAARPFANGSPLEAADLDDHVSDTYEFFLDNTSIGLADFDETTDSWLLDYTSTVLPDGTYALSLATTDTVGNTSAPEPNLAFTLVVDTQAPSLIQASRTSATVIKLDLSENGQIKGTNPTDFEVRDEQSNSYSVSSLVQGPSSDEILLNIPTLGNASGLLTITYTNNNGEVLDLAGNEMPTDLQGVSLKLEPELVSATKDSNTQITLTFDQNVQTNETNPGDFIVTDAAGRTYAVTAQTDGTAGDTDIVLTVSDLSKIVGKLIVTYNNAHNEISDAASGLGFTVTDATGVVIERPFITTWRGSEVTVPAGSNTAVYSVDWGDGTFDTNVTGRRSHTYADDGTHTVTITGDFPSISGVSSAGDLLTVEQWGSIQWESMRNAFNGAGFLTVPAKDAPDLTKVTSMENMFRVCTRLTDEDFNHWDVSNVRDMNGVFLFATSFNAPLESWDVSNVTNMSDMFNAAYRFNQPLDSWDVGNVEDMNDMFNRSQDFNQPLNSWNVGKVKDMSYMFSGATSFNQPLSNWDVSNVELMNFMFITARAFDQDLGDWNIRKVRDMRSIFQTTSMSERSYDRTLMGWDDLPSKLTGIQFGYSFGYCEAFEAIQSLTNNYGWNLNQAFQNCYVEVQSAQIENGVYKIGDHIDIKVEMVLPVVVTGTGTLQFTIGSNSVNATLVGTVNNESELTFRYTVQEGDADTDGVLLNSNISIADGVIRQRYDNASGATNIPLRNIQNTNGVLVDGVKPLSGIITGISVDSEIGIDGITNDNTLVFSARPFENGSAIEIADLDDHVSDTYEFFLDDVSIGLAGFDESSDAWLLDYTGTVLSDKAYTLSLVTYDTIGNEKDAPSSLDFALVIDTEAPAAPTADLSSFSDLGVSNSDRITSQTGVTLQGTGEAGAGIEVFVDNVSAGITTADTNGDWSFDHSGTVLTEGSHTVSAMATDAAGNESARGAAQSFNIDITAPAIPTVALTSGSDSGSSDTDGITNQNPAWEGTGESGSTVEIFVDGSSVGTTVVDVSGNWSFEYTGSVLADGTRDITAKATDIAGNTSDASTVLTLTVDTTAPEAPISGLSSTSDSGSSDSDQVTNQMGVTLQGTGEADADIEVFVDNVSAGTTTADANGDWSFDHSGTVLTEGTHTVSATATDAAGNESAQGTAQSFTVDITAPAKPTVALTSDTDSGSSDRDNITNQNPAWEGTGESGSTVEVFTDGSSVGTTTVDGSGNWSFEYTGSALADGTQDITAKATDVAGNTSDSSDALAILIDTTAPAMPTVALTSGSDSGSSDTDGITNQNPTWEGTGESGSTVEIFVDGSSVGATVVDVSGNWSFEYTGSVLADGTRDITAKATDIAGNTSDASTVLTLTVDTTAPEAPLSGLSSTSDSGSSDSDQVTNQMGVTLQGTGEADADIEVFVDNVSAGTTTADANGDWSFDHSGTVLTEGTHTVSATATDAAGNESAQGTAQSFTIDITAPAKPTVGLTSGSDSGTSDTDNITNQNPTWEGTGESGSTVEVFADGSSVGTTTVDGSGNWSFEYTGSALADGTQDITAKATDVAGNISDSSDALAILIDTTAPAIPTVALTSGSDSGSSDTDGITNQNPTWEGTGESGSTLEVFVEGSSVGTATVDGSGNWSFEYTGSALADGTLEVTAKATDAAGNTSDGSDALTILIDTTAPTKPTVTLTSGTDSGSSDTDGITNQNPTWEGTGESGSTLEVFVEGSSVGTTAVDGSGNWSFEYAGSALADGALEVTALATDIAGNTGDSSDALTILIDITVPVKPEITHISDDTGSSDTDAITNDRNIMLSGTAEANAVVEVFMDGVSQGNVQVDNNGNWTLDMTATTLDMSTYAATATATDLAGNISEGSDSFSFTVDFERPDVTLSLFEAPVGASILITAEFSKNVTGFSTGDVTVTDGTLDDLEMIDERTYRLSVLAEASVITVSIGEGLASDLAGNTNTASNQLEVNAIISSLDNFAEVSSLKAYPNPANDVLTIDLSEFDGIPLDISVLSITGKSELKEKGFTGRELRLNTSGYQQGVYLIQVTDGVKLITQKVVIKR